MNEHTESPAFSLQTGEVGYDPIEDRLRASVRATIETMFEEELAEFLGRIRYSRGDGPAKGYRHGHRERQLTGTFGTETVRVPRARVGDEEGRVSEWRSKALPRYRRLRRKANPLNAPFRIPEPPLRNKVERLWARLKERRAVAIRYEKTAHSFMGVLCLAATLDWLKP